MFVGIESPPISGVYGPPIKVVDGATTLPEANHLFKLLYTGMSRAKAILIIVAHKSYEEHLALKRRFGPDYEDHIESMEQMAKDRDSVL